VFRPHAQVLSGAGLHNLTLPKGPLCIREVVLEQGPGHMLDTATLTPLVEAWNPVLRAELKWIIARIGEIVADCILRSEFDAADEVEAIGRAEEEFRNLVMALELITVKAVGYSGPAVSPKKEAGGLLLFHAERKAYGGGPASVEPGHIAVLEEVAMTLDTKPTKRIATALLEYDTALKSDDVRRQLIHAVVALEALFGDEATEALSYKVPLRRCSLSRACGPGGKRASINSAVPTF